MSNDAKVSNNVVNVLGRELLAAILPFLLLNVEILTLLAC